MNTRLLLLLSLALVLSGCGQPRMIDYVQYTGTEGVTIAFVTGGPPEEVYESMPFPVKVELHNKGATSIPMDRLLITFSADPLYVDKGLVLIKPGEREIVDEGLQGRSLAYPDGEERMFGVPAANAFEARRVIGTLEHPRSEITGSVCYAYATILTTEVCIDTNAYLENQRTQPCTAKDLAFSGGQGAPVAITSVEVEAYPAYDDVTGREAIRPYFTLHFQDLGQGKLIGPDTLPLESACTLRDIPPDELGAVTVQAWLFDQELECQPQVVRLFDKAGETRCTIPAASLSDPIYQVSQNFVTTLMVNATYLYKESATAAFSIKRSVSPTIGEPSARRIDGYVYDGDLVRTGEDGNPVTVCDTYAANVEGAPADLQPSLRADSSCACSQEECLRIARRGGACVMQGGVCPSPLFCCSSSPAPVEEEQAETTA